MKSFSQITDTGRGRLLFTSHRLEEVERLYLSTTGDFILCQGNKEFLFPTQKDAISWAVRNNLCKDKREFLSKCVDVVRIPYLLVVPKVRLFELYAQKKPPFPELRAKEFIQHPVYNHCLVKHRGAVELVQLDEGQRAKVLEIVNQIRKRDYYGGSPVSISSEITIYDRPTDTHAHGFRVEHNSDSYDLTCFTALAPQDLPHDIRQHIRDWEIDESAWIKIPDSYEIWSRETRVEFALIAIAVCIHFQLNYENVYSPGENPLDIFQGIDICRDMEPAD
jgi:hypothetical protein